MPRTAAIAAAHRPILRVTLGSGGQLLFCAHHGRAHQDKLQQVALKIDDQTDSLD